MLSAFSRMRFNWVRRRSLLRTPPARLPAFLARYLEVPFPNPVLPIGRATFLALDFETNGLNIEHDSILSVGSVELANSAVELASAWHAVISADAPLSAGTLNEDIIPLHNITHDMLASGQDIKAVIEAIFTQMRGRFLLAHHADIEAGFLQAATLRHFGVHVPVAAVDTMTVESMLLDKKQSAGSLRLNDVRKRYGLPHYTAHHALTDALATAEVFLAQSQSFSGDISVKALLRYFP